MQMNAKRATNRIRDCMIREIEREIEKIRERNQGGVILKRMNPEGANQVIRRSMQMNHPFLPTS